MSSGLTGSAVSSRLVLAWSAISSLLPRSVEIDDDISRDFCWGSDTASRPVYLWSDATLEDRRLRPYWSVEKRRFDRYVIRLLGNSCYSPSCFFSTHWTDRKNSTPRISDVSNCQFQRDFLAKLCVDFPQDYYYSSSQHTPYTRLSGRFVRYGWYSFVYLTLSIALENTQRTLKSIPLFLL